MTITDTIRRTTITQLFDRNEDILSPSGDNGDRNLVLVEAGAPCRLLKCRNIEAGAIEWLIQVHVTEEPGDIAFKWVQGKNV